MAYAETHTVAVTTDGSGNATAFSPVVTGRIQQIVYTKDTFANGVDFTITLEDTGQNLWTESNVNASKNVNPRTAADLESGSASVLTEVGIYAAFERVKIVIAQGGNTLAGSFKIIVT